MAGLLLFLIMPAMPARADAVRDAEWHLAFLDMARVHQITQGEGVTVAVIDNGINGNHPDLAGNVLPGISLLPSHPGNGWDDTDAHGTAMAGLIAAHGHNGGDGVLGIAPKAKIFPLQTKSGTDPGTSDMDGAAIDAAIRQGARVISISIGGSLSTALRDAVMRAQRADVVIVAGVGNKPEINEVTWPARYDGVVAVAGTDRQGNHADFSVTGRQVVIAAPGSDIKSTDTGNGYGTGSGTSNSTARGHPPPDRDGDRQGPEGTRRRVRLRDRQPLRRPHRRHPPTPSERQPNPGNDPGVHPTGQSQPPAPGQPHRCHRRRHRRCDRHRFLDHRRPHPTTTGRLTERRSHVAEGVVLDTDRRDLQLGQAAQRGLDHRG